MSIEQQKHEGVMPREIAVEGNMSLCLLTPEDAPRFYEMLQQNSDITEYIGWMKELNSEEKVRSKLADFQVHQALRYGISDNGELIGYVGIWKDPDVNDAVQYNIGYFLDKLSRGKGLVGKSLEKLLETAESKMKIERFSAWVEEGNEASVKVLEKLGFKSTGIPHTNSSGNTSWDYVREVNDE